MKTLRYAVGGFITISLLAIGGIAAAQVDNFDDFGGGIFEVPLSVDLKVNGQDGPITVEATRLGNAVITASWLSEGAHRCRGNWSRNDIAKSGTIRGGISRSVVIKVACIDQNQNRVDDAVVVNIVGKPSVNQPVIPQPTQSQETGSAASQPSITVVSPNGGETIGLGSDFKVSWRYSGADTGKWVYTYLKLPNGAYCFLGANPVANGNSVFGIAPGYRCPNIQDQIVFPSAGYKIMIVVDVANVSYMKIAENIIARTVVADESDAPFTITATTTSAQEMPTMSASRSQINSGESVRLNFTFPRNSGKATLTINCPASVTTRSTPEVCNTAVDVTSNGNYTLTFYNTSAQAQKVGLEYGVVLPDGSSGGGGGSVSVLPSSYPTGNTGAGNVGAGGVASSTPPKLSATAPTISGTRTAAGDKLYPGSMSITSTVQNTGGPLTSSVSARFQYSPNNGQNWYDFQEVGPITTTPKNVSHTWEGGTGNFCFRLMIGSGTDNVSSPTCIEIVSQAGAFIGVSRQFASAGVPENDIWSFLKAFFGGGR